MFLLNVAAPCYLVGCAQGLRVSIIMALYSTLVAYQSERWFAIQSATGIICLSLGILFLCSYAEELYWNMGARSLVPDVTVMLRCTVCLVWLYFVWHTYLVHMYEPLNVYMWVHPGPAVWFLLLLLLTVRARTHT